MSLESSTRSVESEHHWREECQSAWLYRVIAAHEKDPAVSDMFRALADAADVQASLWTRQMQTPPPAFRPEFRARLAARLLRWWGPRAVKPMLASLKIRGLSALSGRGSGLTHAMPTEVGEVGARHRGVGSGGNLRAAVFGVNDGLVSNTCLILGMAGAGGDAKTLLGTGVAGLMAGALSMAAGEYVSMRSQREVFESQIALERAELAQYPEEEIEELALIYQARGLDLESARRFARELVRTPEHALDTLAREELGLNPDELGSPWGAAFASFGAFAGGALIPLVPWIFGVAAALSLSLGLAVISLFAVGASLSLFTGRSALISGLRMVSIGAGAGAATWGIGQLFGVAAGAL